MTAIIKVLLGSWFIVSSNFPMWLKGNKENPTFNYSLVEGKKGVLLDEVKYHKNGKQKTITGYDHQESTDSLSFVWKGKGLLFIAKSKWRVAMIDPQGKWAVIHFSKTLFTPEGVDIISREKTLDAQTLAEIKANMAKDKVLNKHLKTLENIRQE